jgi:hypothetical protein
MCIEVNDPDFPLSADITKIMTESRFMPSAKHDGHRRRRENAGDNLRQRLLRPLQTTQDA